MACNFVTMWKRDGKDHAIEMHCEMALLDDMHPWRLIGGLCSYALVAEAAVLSLRGVTSEEDLLMADEDPTALAMIRAVFAHLVRGPVRGEQ